MPADPDTDPFRPPKVPTLVGCLHCQQVYESYRIEWQERPTANGQPWGFWCCPIEGCGGAGFGCDIFPIDPDWTDENGERMWVEDDEEDYPEDDEDESPADRPREAGGGEDIPF